MRKKARVDDNHGQIVKALRQCGCSVLSLASLGRGAPDILVADTNKNLFLAEIKDGDKSPSRQRLTDDEWWFHHSWRGTIHILRSVDDALAMIGAK